mmetsp:Transcript_38118/g.85919  ORF Transcript_38118/g.85919 Transcript_38118/m.85919 type:complete len:338 (-) Transcript_38118:1455-2468(-)
MPPSEAMAAPTYVHHRSTRKSAVAMPILLGPPSSPPQYFRRSIRTPMVIIAVKEKTPTLIPRLPPTTTKAPLGWSLRMWGLSFSQPISIPRASHSGVRPWIFQYTAPNIHGMPRPRKTFTELLPVTLPMLLSAKGSWTAAVLEANVSGSDVPSATKVTAQMGAFMSSAHPSRLAMSPMMAVRPPIIAREQKKQTHPSRKSTGGTIAKSIFQGKAAMCRTTSSLDASAWFSRLPPTYSAAMNWSFHATFPNSSSSQLNSAMTLSQWSFLPGSETIITVRMSLALPPSVFLSKCAPPDGSSRMMRNVSVFSCLPLGKISIRNMAWVWLWANFRVPEVAA